MNIALLCFGIGTIANIAGTEKVFVEMANAMSERGHTVYAVWNDAPGVMPHYPFAAEVRPYNLGLGKIKVPLLAKLLREIGKCCRLDALNRIDEFRAGKLAQAMRAQVPLDQIDVFVCFEFNSVMVANRVAAGCKPVVAMVHNAIDNQLGKLTRRQLREADQADVYQVLMPGFVAQAERLLNTPVVAIPNTVAQADRAQCADLAGRRAPFTIVTVGRVEPNQKQTHLLIQAFARIAGDFPDWQLHYYGPVGDAAYKRRIDDYVVAQGLAGRIVYGGTTDDVASVLRQADIFGFPSAYEGFGLALAEAMTLGVPAVGFAYADAVKDLIRHGHNGLLAENEADLSQQLAKLMQNPPLRAAFGQAAHEDMKAYRPEAVWRQWEDLLAQQLAKYRA